MWGQPCAGDDATRGLQGAIQHNSSWSVSPLTVSDNKGQNCAHGLGTVRLCSSAGISLLCALIMYCTKTPSSAAPVCPLGALELPVFSPAVCYLGGELVLVLTCCFRDCLSCRAPGRCSRDVSSGGLVVWVFFSSSHSQNGRYLANELIVSTIAQNSCVGSQRVAKAYWYSGTMVQGQRCESWWGEVGEQLWKHLVFLF